MPCKYMKKSKMKGLPKPKLPGSGKVRLPGKASTLAKKSMRRGLLKPRKGQQFMIGIMIAIMALIIFIATIPAIKEMMNGARSCQYLNCAGYVDRDASAATCGGNNKTYDSTLEEDTLACVVLDLGIPYLILGVLVVIIAKLMSDRMVERPQQDLGMYGGY